MSTLMFAGDVVPTEPVVAQWRGGAAAPLRALTALRHRADAFIVNLEAPITTAEVRYDGHYSKFYDSSQGARVYFRAPPDAVGLLRDLDVSAVSLANNHIMDFGADGLHHTQAALAQARIAYFGAGETIEDAGRATELEVGGRHIALLGACFTYEAGRARAGALPLRYGDLRRRVRRLAPAHDDVIVSLHGGVEFSSEPQVEMRSLARALIRDGARSVVCHHPHVPQPVEEYQRGLIAYSLGNLIYDTSVYGTLLDPQILRATEIAPILELNLDGDRVSYDIHPLMIRESFPQEPTPSEREAAIGLIGGRSSLPHTRHDAATIFHALRIIGGALRPGRMFNLALIARRVYEAQRLRIAAQRDENHVFRGKRVE